MPSPWELQGFGRTSKKTFLGGSGKDYLKAIRNTIPLEGIFKVVASCHFNYDEEYCPVLLKLGRNYDKNLKPPPIPPPANTQRYQL